MKSDEVPPMKMKTFLPGVLLTILTALPVVTSAAVSLDLTPAGVTIHIGDRDHRGYYWDGYDWRAPKWWQEYHGRHAGEKGPRGYWNGNGWQQHWPEGHRHEPVPKKTVHHKESEHNQPMVQRGPDKNDRLAADHDGGHRLAADRDGHHDAGGHRPDFQPHG
jgi:hypothetical protein